jgi:hypothetical protein
VFVAFSEGEKNCEDCGGERGCGLGARGHEKEYISITDISASGIFEGNISKCRSLTRRRNCGEVQSASGINYLCSCAEPLRISFEECELRME